MKSRLSYQWNQFFHTFIFYFQELSDEEVDDQELMTTDIDSDSH